MCHLSVKLSDMLDPNPMHSGNTHLCETNTHEKNVLPLNKLSRDWLSTWYATDESNRL